MLMWQRVHDVAHVLIALTKEHLEVELKMFGTKHYIQWKRRKKSKLVDIASKHPMNKQL